MYKVNLSLGRNRSENPRFVNDPDQTKPGEVIIFQAPPEMLEDVKRRGRQKYWEEYENPKKRKKLLNLFRHYQ